MDEKIRFMIVVILGFAGFLMIGKLLSLEKYIDALITSLTTGIMIFAYLKSTEV